MEFFKKTPDKQPMASLMSIQLTSGPKNVANSAASKPSVGGYMTTTTNSGTTSSANPGYSSTSSSIPPPPPHNYNFSYPSVNATNRSMQALNASYPPSSNSTRTTNPNAEPLNYPSPALTSVTSNTRADNANYQSPIVGHRMPINPLFGNLGKFNYF